MTTAPPRLDDPRSQLSKRERQIGRLYVDGRSHKQIAGALGIAPATVRTHLRSVYRKLEVGNRIGLLRCFSKELTPAAERPSSGPDLGRALVINGDARAVLALSKAIESLLCDAAPIRYRPSSMHAQPTTAPAATAEEGPPKVWWAFKDGEIEHGSAQQQLHLAA